MSIAHLKHLTLLLLTWCLFLPKSALAQQPNEVIEVGILAQSYNGELSAYENLSPGIVAALKFNKNRLLNGQLVLGIGEVNASQRSELFDAGSPVNKFFSASFFHFHVETNINIIKRERFSLFLSQGFGLMRFNPTDDAGNSLQNQGATRMPTELYDLTSIILPTGLGAHYFINDQIGFSAQIGLRNPQTDYLDNISAYGNPNNNDQILFFKVGFLHAIKLRKHDDVIKE